MKSPLRSAQNVLLCLSLLLLGGCKPEFEVDEYPTLSDAHLMAPFEEFPLASEGAPGANFTQAHTVMESYENLIRSEFGVHLEAISRCDGTGLKWHEGKHQWNGRLEFEHAGVPYHAYVISEAKNEVWEIYIAQKSLPLPSAPSVTAHYGTCEFYPIRETSIHFMRVSISGVNTLYTSQVDFQLQDLGAGAFTAIYDPDDALPWTVFADGQGEGDWLHAYWNPTTKAGDITSSSCPPDMCCWDSTLADALCP